MKKIIFAISILLISVVSVYALSNNFSFDSTKLTFSSNSKTSDIVSNFNSDYKLSYSVANEDEDLIKKITELSKKTTSLLLGDIGSSSETSEHYYNRHKEYRKLAAYNYFPKDSNSNSGYDETIENYKYAVISEIAIPQVFNSFNELDVVYNSYGDIRVTVSNDLVISMVLLPNVKIKEENKLESEKYDIKEENLVIYYYFIKIDNEYRLCYLYGEYGNEVEKYFTALENNESKNTKALVSSYSSNLSTMYNYDKLNSLKETTINEIYNKNINNLVYITSYYNNKLINSSNGFFINDGIVVTTWSFLEKALIDSQYIVIKDSNYNNYEIEGIITANTESDIVLIKLKNQIGRRIELGDSSNLKTEDPVITISSKTGLSYIIQKGIVVSNSGYIQTSIPLSDTDEGSVLLNSNGKVIGLNTSKTTNASISMAINSKALEEIQNKFNNIKFDSIKTITFEELKENYYLKSNSENVINTISNRMWKRYSSIGDIENSIKLELVKASYKDDVLSLRYKNNISDYISSMMFSGLFKERLINSGYEEILNSNTKCIFQNKKYQIIIMDEFDYLIVVMVKL